MSRQRTERAPRLLILGCSALLACTTALAVEPPPWWTDPNPGTPELVYEKGSSGKASTEAQARQKAYDAGLMAIRMRITADTNLWPRIQLVGSDIAFESTQEDTAGRWHAWLLVSYPKSQFEKALRRAEDLAKKLG